MTETTTLEIPEGAQNPVEPFLRMDRMPHIWCPGCGIGTTVNCFTRALLDSKVNLDKVAVVSGIGCTGRVAGYARLDSFHTTHGRAIQLARSSGIRAGKFRLITAWPFPTERIRELAGRVKAFVVPELNLGQMVLEVERAAAGQARVIPVSHAGGTVHNPDNILNAIVEAAR